MIPKGERTRQSILDRAVDLASLEGLERLTIGRLSEELEMSKSGLFAHFGSKEELQIATIEAAGARFIGQVFRPALAAKRGYPRLLAICKGWVEYARSGVFPGGCFFAAASFEFDGRPGVVRDFIAKLMNDWIAALERAVREAQDEGDLVRTVSPQQLAFELNSLFFGANFALQLRHDRKALDHLAAAIRSRLEGLRIKPSRTATRRSRSGRPGSSPRSARR